MTDALTLPSLSLLLREHFIATTVIIRAKIITRQINLFTLLNINLNIFVIIFPPSLKVDFTVFAKNTDNIIY